MNKLTDKYIRKVKNNKFYFLFSFILILFIAQMILASYSAEIENSDKIGNIETSATDDFSDKFENNEYDNFDINLNQFYDGTETFFDDTHLSQPIYWDCVIPSSTNTQVYSSSGSHSNILLNTHASNSWNWLSATYQIDTDLTDVNEILEVSFWCRTTAIWQKSTRYNLYDGSTRICGVEFTSSGLYAYYYPTSHYYKLFNTASDVWYFINIKIEHGLGNILDVYWSDYGGVLHYYGASGGGTIELTSFCFDMAGNTAGTYYSSLDALTFTEGYRNVGSYVYHDGSNDKYKSQILATIPETFSKNDYINYVPFDSNDKFSNFESIIDEESSSNNNFREYYITDGYLNDYYVDKNRVMRKTDTDTDQTTYKVIQFYFDDLDINWSFSEGLNQTIIMRVDSFDVSNNLMNKYFLNIEFNNETGLITWDAYYKNPTLKRWEIVPTNPIFNFSDYLSQNESIKTLEITIHFKLSEIDSHKWIDIRTEVCFNGYYQTTYIYDKSIDGGFFYGSNTYYDGQTRLLVRTLDYFNLNDYDKTYYVSGIPYTRAETYNNLRGIRTLQVSDTYLYNNFLDVGFFSDRLNLVIPPEPVPDAPDEPSAPTGTYWTYTTFVLTDSTITNINYVDDIDFFDTTVEVELDYEHTFVVGTTRTAKFYYNAETFSKSDFGDWTFEIVLDVEVSFNIIRNVVVWILNSIMLLVQYAWFLLTVAFNFIIMYLICVLIVPFFWNVIVYYVLSGLIYVGFIIVCLFVWIIGILWTFINWIYEELLLPFAEWLYEVALPLFIEFIITVAILIITCFMWVAFFGQRDFWQLYDTNTEMVYMVIDFVIDLFVLFFENYPYFIMYFVYYVILIGFTLIDWIYTKSRGFTKRAESLKIALEVYIFPFIVIYSLIIKIKELLFKNT